MKHSFGKPLTSDEINEKMSQRIQERAKQDVEFHDRYKEATSKAFLPIKDKPLTSDEISEKMFQRIQERAKQDAEFRNAYILATSTPSQFPHV